MNGVHTIVSYLDIFEKVGKAVGHDEYIPFKVNKGKILVNDEESELVGKKLRVEFIKGNQDNPKINAIYVMKGSLEGLNLHFLNLIFLFKMCRSIIESKLFILMSC